MHTIANKHIKGSVGVANHKFTGAGWLCASCTY